MTQTSPVDVLSPGIQRRLAEAGLVGLFLLAIWGFLVSGVPWPLVVGVVVLAFGAESLISGKIRSAVATDARADAQPADADLADTVGAVARDLAVPIPRVSVVEEGSGVTVLDAESGPLLVVARSTLESLDEDALRAVVAHELAHLTLGHLDRIELRDPVAHVVGLSAFTVVVLQHVPAGVAVFAGALYLVSALFHAHPVRALVYLLGSVGLVIVPIALAAHADRCEEFMADDVAATRTSPAAFCRGLWTVTGPGGPDPAGDASGGRPMSERRGPFARLTARHPTVDRRLARFDMTPADVDADF